MTSSMTIVVLIVMTVVSMMMRIHAEDKSLPIRIAPILNRPSSPTTIVQTKKTVVQSKQMHLQGQSPLTYGGSAVFHIPRVYLVFWGSQWINNDPSGEAAIITSLMQGIAAMPLSYQTPFSILLGFVIGAI